MTYKFHGCVYHSQEEMLDAIAYEWVHDAVEWVPPAWGLTNTERLLDFLARLSDEALAERCISFWELDLEAPNGYGEEIVSHMEEYGYGEEELAEAFARLRGVICRNEVTSVA